MADIPPGAVVNEEGQVAMRFMKQANSFVQCGQNGYVFVVRANIAISYVNPEDLDCILGYRIGCCGGRKKQAIFFADETHYRRWSNGGGS